jgi:hypothetical protein
MWLNLHERTASDSESPNICLGRSGCLDVGLVTMFCPSEFSAIQSSSHLVFPSTFSNKSFFAVIQGGLRDLRRFSGTNVNRFYAVCPRQRPRRLKIFQNRPLYCLPDRTAIMSDNANINNTQNSPFQGFLTRDIGPWLIIFQLNVQGLSRDKRSYLARLLSELKADIVLLQKTHVLAMM